MNRSLWAIRWRTTANGLWHWQMKSEACVHCIRRMDQTLKFNGRQICMPSLYHNRHRSREFDSQRSSEEGWTFQSSTVAIFQVRKWNSLQVSCKLDADMVPRCSQESGIILGRLSAWTRQQIPSNEWQADLIQSLIRGARICSPWTKASTLHRRLWEIQCEGDQTI